MESPNSALFRENMNGILWWVIHSDQFWCQNGTKGAHCPREKRQRNSSISFKVQFSRDFCESNWKWCAKWRVFVLCVEVSMKFQQTVLNEGSTNCQNVVVNLWMSWKFWTFELWDQNLSREKVKQIPDDDVMANESVKMVQRQGSHKASLLDLGLGKIWNLVPQLGPNFTWLRIIEQTFAVIRSVLGSASSVCRKAPCFS